MSLSWANQLAKNALKNAQQKIDSVLDIRTDEEGTSAQGESIIIDDPLLTPVPQDFVEEPTSEAHSPVLPLNDVPTLDDGWGSAWNPTESNIVVESEPNPIGDDGHPTGSSLLDHSPSSHSSDNADSTQSPVKISHQDYQEVDLSAPSDSSIISHEPVLPPYRGSRRNSHHDDSATVASSDIEVIRNVDAWSLASSKVATNDMSLNVLSTKPELAVLEAELKMAEQRRNELKSSNDQLQKANGQLQQRIVLLNQQQNSLKHDLESKNKELEDLMKEGKQISDYSGKQSREIRRLKNELSDLEKIKSERKRFKEEKLAAEETIDLQLEEISSLKGMVKTLESNLELLKKEQNLSVASTEVVQKHIDEQMAKISDLEAELKKKDVVIHELEAVNKNMSSELDIMQSSQITEKLAGERAHESAASISCDLEEAREQVQRLTAQLRTAEMRIEAVMSENSNVAEIIAQANAPLLNEINDLKSQLVVEQSQNEESDAQLRHYKEKIRDLEKQMQQMDQKTSQLFERQRKEHEMSQSRNTQLEQELERLRLDCQEQSRSLQDQKRRSDDVIAELREQVEKETQEAHNVRKNLKIFKEENDSLKEELIELKKSLEKVQTTRDSVTPTNDFLEPQLDIKPIAYKQQEEVFYPHVNPYENSAAQIKLENVPHVYDGSSQRIQSLEREINRLHEVEINNKTLKKELKTLKDTYEQLLELDGERLEKIEELTHDVIDLRKLLKDQLIAFAEANSTNFVNKEDI